jgi:eukaryotic-like serine/threonine-protein kinase
VLYECLTGEPVMPVTKDRQARMQARRYQDVEDTLRRNGPARGLTPPLMRLLGKMMAYEPTERFQNPTQMVEGIQNCRAELAGGGVALSKTPAGPKTLFVVEANQKLQDAFRDKFKADGYRVILTLDPGQAAKRFKQQPFHALLIDARTVGRDGVDAYNDVLRAADDQGLEITAVLILGEDQAGWKVQARQHARGSVLTDPGVTMKQLLRALKDAPPDDAPA